jgi:cytochrome c oxidase subunit 1
MVAIPVPAPAPRSRPVSWRRCQVTGLAVDRSAERVVMVNAVTAVLFLAAGGVMALLIALTRWEAVHLLPSEWFYRLVGAHCATMLIFWILFFEVAGLAFGSTILLNTRLMIPTLSWITYAMMLSGALMVEVTMLSGHATVMFTAYPPLLATSWFYLGMLLVMLGGLIAVIHYIINVTAARLRGEVRTLPLFSFALLAASILGIFTLLAGVVAVFPAWLWSLGAVDHVDPGVYRLLYWGFGHGAQQVNLAAMVGTWYVLATLTTGAKPINEGLSRLAIVLYILFIQLGSIHHLLVDPGLGLAVRGVNTSYLVYAAVLGSMIHAFSIPASIEVALRDQGFWHGLFGWLRHAPWKEPGFAALVLSFWLFGVLGGISGVIMGGVQTNMIEHNTLIAPAHFHMTVVSGTTLAFMGLTFYLVPLVFRREHLFPRMARLQPYVFAVGMTVWGLGMGYAGHLGAPRRHWDINFPTMPLATGLFDGWRMDLSLALLGIGAIIAVTGGAMFVLNTAGTVFLGRRSDAPNLGRVSPVAFGLPAVAGASSEAPAAPARPHGKFEAPGTLVLAFAWLLLFVVLYGISWWELSSVSWGIH